MDTAFSRLRPLSRTQKGAANVSSSSLASSKDGDVPDGSSGLIGKVKGRISRRGSVDDRSNHSEEPPERRLSTIIARTKRHIRSSREDGPERNLSTDSHIAPDVNLSDSSSLMVSGGSGRSSLLTDDGDERVDSNNNPIRPSLSTHSSHAGYLTLSSPDLDAHTTAVIADSTAFEAELKAEPSANIPHIIEPAATTATLPATSPSPSPSLRSPSPTNKIRGKLTLHRNKSGDSDNSAKSTGSGVLGGLFNLKTASRRNSINEQQGHDELGSDGLQTVQAVTRASQERPETPQQIITPIQTALPATPPNLLDTPLTLVTPPTPTDPSPVSATFRPLSPTKGSPAPRPLNSVESIRHRRAQSANLPSKLSTTTSAPLTPTLEEAKTPGGTLTHGTSGDGNSGFFSSFLSATQKAAGSVGSGINILQFQKNKPSSTPQSVDAAEGGEEVIPGPDSRPTTGLAEGQTTPLAIETIGKGDLNFAHLGISENASDLMASTNDVVPAQVDVPTQEGDGGRKEEEEAAARAVSSAYERSPSETATVVNGSNRPLSIASNERLTLGEQTPTRTGAGIDTGNVKRSSSVRSRLSGHRKHRGSSATVGTSNSIGAALRESSSGLAQTGAYGAGHRLTGFAVASSKRNKDFHTQFRSVPEDDYLIEDYSAALQRDILLHGRLYVSEGHICFSSNILGWVTNLVISFDEVISMEKKSTAVIFPNALIISTLQARNTFASFVARDSTYELLVGIWKISHPNLKSSLNGVVLDNAGTGDKTEVAEVPEGHGGSTDGSEDEVYDEDADEDEEDAGSFTDGGFGASDAGSTAGDISLSRKTSGAPVAVAPQVNGAVPKVLDGTDVAVTGAAAGSEYPGVSIHEPTECTESSEHYEKSLTDTTIPAPLGQVYSLMFGPASGTFMKKWLVDDQKSRELNYNDDKTGLDNDHKTFTFDYIKPLYNPVGPKQTRCTTTNTLKAFDLDRAVSVECSTVTPDVPSGSSFTTKTRYCLMWGPNNSTRMVASFTLEWTAKSWLKGAIESGALSGQTDYVKAIVAALKAAVTTKPPVKGPPRKSKRKGYKKEASDSNEVIAHREPSAPPADANSNWGLFEPVRPILEPFVAIFRPFVNSQVIIAVLVVLLSYSWLFPGRGGDGVGYPGHTPKQRIAAYEEIWKREESALWDWLEDRIGLAGVYAPPIGQEDRQKVLDAKSMGKKLETQRMSERQMDAAIRSTEEKLAALKKAVERRKTTRSRES